MVVVVNMMKVKGSLVFGVTVTLWQMEVMKTLMTPGHSVEGSMLGARSVDGSMLGARSIGGSPGRRAASPGSIFSSHCEEDEVLYR